jgi:acetyl-CoA C-acetyltransferase
MVAEPAPGLAAMVLACEDVAAERDGVAWVQGIGWATEPSFLGDRDLSQAPALEAAAARAYEQAGISRPLKEFDVAEVSDAVPHHELVAYESLGLSDRASWAKDVANGTFARAGALPVNLSGGVAAVNPVYAVGFLRILEAAQQVRGRAGAHQKAGVKRAVAHAASGFAMQYQTVAVLGREPGGSA